MEKIAIISLLIIIAAIIGYMRLKLDPIPEPANMFLSGEYWAYRFASIIVSKPHFLDIGFETDLKYDN